MAEWVNFGGLRYFKELQDKQNEKYVDSEELEQVISDRLTNVYTYKGTVDSADKLPKSGNKVGDVYDVASGMNYAWNGSRWDELGEFKVDITVDTALNDKSENPVQNKAITAELNKKAGLATATQESNGLMSSSDKIKLDEANYRVDDMEDIVDGINDYTTGINLLRGTRDFKQGTENASFGTSKHYYDGFTNSGDFSFYKDEDGFTVAHKEQSGLSADAYKYIYGSIIHLEPNEIATFSYEFMVDDVEIWDRKFVGHVQCFESGTSTNVFKIDLYPKIVGVNSVESGKWCKARYVINPNSDKPLDLRVGFYLIRNGSINYRKACIYKGEINNPIWSPSPFDTDYINDITTGINLLKGTRDSLEGKTLVDGATSSVRRYSDGFWIHSSTVRGIDDGYGTLTYKAGANIGSLSSFKTNTFYTVFCDVMFDGSEDTTGAVITLNTFKVPKNGSDTISQGVNKAYKRSDLESIYGTFENGKWYHISISDKLTPSENDLANYDFYITGMFGRGTIKKCGLYEGCINNPIWSASPFDVLQNNDLIGANGIVNLDHVDSAHEIAGGDDLNKFTTPGTYACMLSVNAQKVLHCPTTRAFKLYVEISNGENVTTRYIRQTLVDYNAEADIYTRYIDNTVSTNWSNWRQTYANTTVRPLAGGGTGATTAREAQYNLLNGMGVVAANNVTDSRNFIVEDTNPNATNGSVCRASAANVWNWIASKIRSVFGFTEDNKLPADNVEHSAEGISPNSFEVSIVNNMVQIKPTDKYDVNGARYNIILIVKYEGMGNEKTYIVDIEKYSNYYFVHPYVSSRLSVEKLITPTTNAPFTSSPMVGFIDSNGDDMNIESASIMEAYKLS